LRCYGAFVNSSRPSYATKSNARLRQNGFVTLLQTIVRPEGIWQSVDYRLTSLTTGAILDDAAPKQLTVLCPPLPGGPHVLLAFTGLAQTPDGTPTLKWIRETISGQQRTIGVLLEHLRDRLTRDIGHSHLGVYGLIVVGGIFESKGKRSYFEISNFDPITFAIRPDFELTITEIKGPRLLLAGSGRRAVAKSDIDLVNKESTTKPANWEEHLRLLAQVNRRAAERSKKIDPKGVGTVSPWCHVTYLAEGEDGAKGRDFREPGDPPKDLSLEIVMVGMDLTDATSVFLARTKGAALTDKDMEEAIRRGLKGRP
jgi:hypothetical protein